MPAGSAANRNKLQPSIRKQDRLQLCVLRIDRSYLFSSIFVLFHLAPKKGVLRVPGVPRQVWLTKSVCYMEQL